MKKTVLALLFCLTVCFAMGACASSKTPDEPYGIMTPTQALYDGLDLLKPHPTQAINTTDQVDYRIVIDDGYGMSGFVANYCTSYRAAWGAVMDATIGGNRTYIPASKLSGDTANPDGWSETLLGETADKSFYREKSNNIPNVIEAMADQYDDDNQVMILISDLMIPTEDGCMKATSAIRNTFLTPENTTAGIIGIVGDFCGTIENLPVNPKTGYARKISDYMVLERDENGVFRHPLYILFLGNDKAVLNAMEKAMTNLKNCGLLDESSNPYHALYFSEYDLQHRETDGVSFEFDMGHQEYNAANYDMKYIVRGIADENDKIEYPSPNVIPKDYQLLLADVPMIKLYAEAKGESKNNVVLRCTIPYTLTDSAERGDSITDKHKLLVAAKDLALSDTDYSVSVDLRILEYEQKDGGSAKAEWVVPDQSLVRCESKDIKVKDGTITVGLTVNTELLASDDPLLVTVGVRVQINPKWEEIEALYTTDWVSDWSLNLKDFEKEFIRQSASPSSARFTYATTAKTPFLSNLLVGGIADQQIEIMRDVISDKTIATVQTGMFGIVVRDIPRVYLNRSDIDKLEDFDGWAFSFTHSQEIKNDLRSGN